MVTSELPQAAAAAVAPALRIVHIRADRHVELPGLPQALPADGFLWVGCTRRAFEADPAALQAALERWTGGQLVDLHVSDLLNRQLPSHFDYTSWYDLLVFRRLSSVVPVDSVRDAADDAVAAASPHRLPLLDTALTAENLDTSAVGFAVFDRVLLTVHPSDCRLRDFVMQRLAQMAPAGDARADTSRSSVRLPTSPADLMLRMVNHMVDGYLELRRRLTRQLTQLQQVLFDPYGRFDRWGDMLALRNALHLLEDTCEDQRSAMLEWLDAVDEWPPEADPALARERELLRVRSRDVLEHIERVVSHVRRLDASAESAVQMHFSALGNRTNEIMRTLTVLTAIFLPMNLITGIFGMNFEVLPLLHNRICFYLAMGTMALIATGLVIFFRRKRYLSTGR